MRPAHLLITGIILAVSFWFVDAWIDSLFFTHDTYLESLLPREGVELYMRALACLLLAGFGFFGYRVSQRIAEIARSRERLQRESESLTRALSGILPICAFCKNIRDDEGNWQTVERYVAVRSDARFSHTFCPECMKHNYPDMVERPTDTDR